MNICLVRPPVFDKDYYQYPLNIEYISASLKRDKHNVSFVDGERIAGCMINKILNKDLFGIIKNIVSSKSQIITQNIKLVDSFFQDEEYNLWNNIANEIVLTKPDIVGFSCYTESISSTRIIVETLRKNFGLNVPIILGGIHPTVLPIETMKNLPGVDFLVCGEGEIVVRDLTKTLEGNGKKLDEIKGICYRKNGEIMLKSQQEMISDLNDLPILDFNFALTDHRFVILTSRGCPFNCKFCSSNNMWTRSVRYRPTDHVVQEIENLTRKVSIKSLRIGDDTFTLNKRHMKGIAEGLKLKGIDLQISVGSRIDTIDKEKLDILKSMGVCHISFGIETGSKKIMKQINKEINVNDVVSKVRMVNDEGIESTTFFIINHPTETKEDMLDSFKLIKKLSKECKQNVVSLNTGFPYPGTEWWDHACEENLVSNINFYKKPTTYNHLGPPVVNMSSESMETLVNVKQNIGQFLTIKRWQRKAKKSIKEPSYLLQKIKKLQ